MNHKKYKKAYDVEFNYRCGHKEKLTNVSKNGAEKLRQQMYEDQFDLCGKCYSEYCKEHGIIPWYSK